MDYKAEHFEFKSNLYVNKSVSYFPKKPKNLFFYYF